MSRDAVQAVAVVAKAKLVINTKSFDDKESFKNIGSSNVLLIL